MQFIEEHLISPKGIRSRLIPVGADVHWKFGEEPIVVSIAPNYVGMAEKWFMRHVKEKWSERWCNEQSWLVLFNGAYLSTDADRKVRYQVEKPDKDSLYFVTDTNFLPAHWSESKYLQIAVVRKKIQAELIRDALNAYQPKPKRRRKNG